MVDGDGEIEPPVWESLEAVLDDAVLLLLDTDDNGGGGLRMVRFFESRLAVRNGMAFVVARPPVKWYSDDGGLIC